MEMEKLYHDIDCCSTWLPWKKLNSPPGSAILEIYKIRNADLQFQSPGQGWQKNEKKKEKKNNTGNCIALWVSGKRNKPNSNNILKINNTEIKPNCDLASVACDALELCTKFLQTWIFFLNFSKRYSASAFKMRNFELYTISFHLLNIFQ